jgi:hypothetical protein
VARAHDAQHLDFARLRKMPGEIEDCPDRAAHSPRVHQEKVTFPGFALAAAPVAASARLAQ